MKNQSTVGNSSLVPTTVNPNRILETLQKNKTAKNFCDLWFGICGLGFGVCVASGILPQEFIIRLRHKSISFLK
jgi:hypothetical protein